MDTVDSAITKPAHRLEVFTGAGHRRTRSDADKARVVAEIGTSGDSVSGVARRYGLSPQPIVCLAPARQRSVKRSSSGMTNRGSPGGR